MHLTCVVVLRGLPAELAYLRAENGQAKAQQASNASHSSSAVSGTVNVNGSSSPAVAAAAGGMTNTAHRRVRCDGCMMGPPLLGERWKCMQCPDFDYCGTCYARGQHSHTPGHTFIQQSGDTLSTAVPIPVPPAKAAPDAAATPPGVVVATPTSTPAVVPGPLSQNGAAASAGAPQFSRPTSEPLPSSSNGRPQLVQQNSAPASSSSSNSNGTAAAAAGTVTQPYSLTSPPFRRSDGNQAPTSTFSSIQPYMQASLPAVRPDDLARHFCYSCAVCK
jgi:hypothetical protein